MVSSGSAEGGILLDGCAELPDELLLVVTWGQRNAPQMGVAELRELTMNMRESGVSERMNIPWTQGVQWLSGIAYDVAREAVKSNDLDQAITAQRMAARLSANARLYVNEDRQKARTERVDD